MAVQSDTSRIQYAGNNSTTTSYAVPFVFQENSHLKAIARTSAGVESVVTLTNHSGAGDPNGGTVRTAVAVPATSTLTIYREVPITQTTSYAEGGDFPAASHERALDKLTQITQQLDRRIDTCVRGSEATPLSVIPSPVGSESYVLASTFGQPPSWQPQSSIGIGPVTATGSTTARFIADRFSDTVNVKDFGARGDGTTNDRNAIQAALDAANTGRAVFFPAGTYVIGSSLNLANGKIYRMVGNGAVLQCSNNTITMFSVDAASIYLDGLRFTTASRFFNYITATASANIVFEARDCEFDNAAQYVIQDSTAQTHSVVFTRWTLDACLFRNNRFDVYIARSTLREVIVNACRFLDGGPISLNLQGDSVNFGTNYVFSGNIWRNYVNNQSGSDADGQFIRCYGNRATITGNIFDTLTVASGTSGSDTEALRPACRNLVISGNIFRNAGMAEGVITLKGGDTEAIITGNSFECTDDYNTIAAASGFPTRAILANRNTTISNNTFTNFTGCIVDMGDVSFGEGSVHITDNAFVNCACTGYSSRQLLRLTANNVSYHVKGNVVSAIESSPKYPRCIFRITAGGLGRTFSATGLESTDVITAAGHTFVANQPVRFTALTGGSGLATSTFYYVRDISGDTFKLSASKEGSVIDFTTDITAATIQDARCNRYYIENNSFEGDKTVDSFVFANVPAGGDFPMTIITKGNKFINHARIFDGCPQIWTLEMSNDTFIRQYDSAFSYFASIFNSDIRCRNFTISNLHYILDGGADSNRIITIRRPSTDAIGEAECRMSVRLATGAAVAYQHHRIAFRTISGTTTIVANQNSGTATVATGTTFIDVAHGLVAAPTAQQINVVPTNNMGNASHFWVSNIDATNFRINVDADPNTTAATFAWNIRLTNEASENVFYEVGTATGATNAPIVQSETIVFRQPTNYGSNSLISAILNAKVVSLSA